jgi:hypothetical protein
MTCLPTLFARRWSVALTAALVVAAALLWHHLPVPTRVYAPFDVRGSVGSPVRGRALIVIVNKVQLAPRAKLTVSRFATRTVSATGRWVVVDATVSATETSVVPSARLVVGDNRYQPSSRADTSGPTGWVDPGIPQRVSWVFDIANELIEPSPASPLQLRVWTGDERLDSRLVIDLDRPAPQHVDVATVKMREVGPA